MRAHSHLIPSDDCTEQLDFTSQSIRWLHMAVMIIIFIINHLFIFNCFKLFFGLLPLWTTDVEKQGCWWHLFTYLQSKSPMEVKCISKGSMGSQDRVPTFLRKVASNSGKIAPLFHAISSQDCVLPFYLVCNMFATCISEQAWEESWRPVDHMRLSYSHFDIFFIHIVSLHLYNFHIELFILWVKYHMMNRQPL